MRAAAFLGLDGVRKAAVSQLTATLRGMTVDDIRAAACAADGVDEVSDAQKKAAIDGMFLIPSLDGLRSVGATPPDADHSDSDGLVGVLGLDFNSVLELTACLDLRDLPTFAKAVRPAQAAGERRLHVLERSLSAEAQHACGYVRSAAGEPGRRG